MECSDKHLLLTKMLFLAVYTNIIAPEVTEKMLRVIYGSI